MTFEEFAACVAGFNRANGGGAGVRHARDWTDADMDEAEALFDEVERRNAARGASDGD
jgi:hypothetical protein